MVGSSAGQFSPPLGEIISVTLKDSWESALHKSPGVVKGGLFGECSPSQARPVSLSGRSCRLGDTLPRGRACQGVKPHVIEAVR